MPSGCFTDETVAVGILNAPPTLYPSFLLAYLFSALSPITQAPLISAQHLTLSKTGILSEIPLSDIHAGSKSEYLKKNKMERKNHTVRYSISFS